MNSYKTQEKKLKAFEYLVSKGYKLTQYLLNSDKCPEDIKLHISTKRIYVFKLFSPSGKEEIDSIICEYGPITSSIEMALESLC